MPHNSISTTSYPIHMPYYSSRNYTSAIYTTASTCDSSPIMNQRIVGIEDCLFEPIQDYPGFRITCEGQYGDISAGWNSNTYDLVNTQNVTIEPYEIEVSGHGKVKVIARNKQEAIQKAIEYVTGNKYGHIDFEEIEKERAKIEEERKNEELFVSYHTEAEGTFYEMKKSMAEEKALKLLTKNLSKIQLERFLKDKCIPIDSQLGNKYLIRKGRFVNIEVLDEDGKVKHKICAHPRERFPDYDTMLAQKLFLESAEEEFLKIANIHGR